MSPVTARRHRRPEIRIDWHGTTDGLSRTLEWRRCRLAREPGERREARRLDQLERGGKPAPESDGLWGEPLPQVETLP